MAMALSAASMSPAGAAMAIPAFDRSSSASVRRVRSLLRGSSTRLYCAPRAVGAAGKVDASTPKRAAAAATPPQPQPQDPLRSFPWDLAAKRFAARLSDLVWTALKWLTIPCLLVSSMSELSYTLVHRKYLFVPFAMLVGIVLAGIMSETAAEMAPNLREGFPWHLVVIGIAFGLIKLPGPSYPFWGRIVLPHLANGGLWQTCYLVWRGYRMKA